MFDSIISGPRYSEDPTALAAESERPAIESANAATESDNGEILSEFDDDPLPEGDEGESLGDFASDPLRIQRQRESESTVIDVEVVDAGYTDAIMSDGSGTTYPRSRSNPARRAHSPGSRTTRADWPSG